MNARRLHVDWLAVAALSCEGPSPTVRLTAAPEGQAVVGVTRMTFTAEASDLPDGLADYAWSFGDGATATGPVARHVFARDGVFDVKVTATGGGRTVEAVTRMTVRSLTGAWSRPGGGSSRGSSPPT